MQVSWEPCRLGSVAHLENLALRGTRVTDEEDVDVATVAWPAGTAAAVDALVGAAKELEEDPLFDVVHLPDARGERARQQLVDVVASRELDQLLLEIGPARRAGRGDDAEQLVLDGQLGLGRALLVVLLAADADDALAHPALAAARAEINAEALLVAALDVDDVEVGLEERLDDALLGVDADGDAAEDAGDLDPVAGLGDVDELVVDAEADGMRRLTVGHLVRRLLKPDDLPVGELAPVVDQAHGAVLAAHLARAPVRLGDPAAVDLDGLGVAAGEAAEEGALHVGDDGRRADDEALDGDDLVNVARVEVAHVDAALGRQAAAGDRRTGHLARVAERSDLVDGQLHVGDDVVAGDALDVVQAGLAVLLGELDDAVLEDLIADGDELLRVVEQLHVEVLGGRKAEQVAQVQVEVRLRLGSSSASGLWSERAGPTVKRMVRRYSSYSLTSAPSSPAT